ncbi:MAG: glycoside hydrolase family 172 protein [Planctomycetota bacterium]
MCSRRPSNRKAALDNAFCLFFLLRFIRISDFEFWIFFLAALALLPAAAWPEDRLITTESLLNEMVERDALARWPQPEYVCRQYGSYDKRSKTPDDPVGWFANGDNMESMGEPVKWETHQGRQECLLLDVDGPGAIVRFWSGGGRPKGQVRFYIDEAEQPAIEAPLYDLLGGKSFVPVPLAITNSGDAINLYFPIPYAKHCKITYDEGKPPAAPPARWYNIEYRVYPAGTKVQSFSMDDLKTAAQTVERVKNALTAAPDPEFGKGESSPIYDLVVEAGGEATVKLPAGPAAVRHLHLHLSYDKVSETDATLRSTILRMNCDGVETIWCPVGDFFGCGPLFNPLNSWYRSVPQDGHMVCRWVMPYQKSASFTLVNLGKKQVLAVLRASTTKWNWDSRSMYFHANWHQERLIQTKKAAGTMDWNYITATGKGVYLGDTLALFNPTKDWWGEGDEKIWVDGENFPSHFGTGSEDYYGYAWGNPTPFQGPFCNQPLAHPHNFGHTTNTRTRSLDAIPFAKSLKFDMEIWHWAACKMDYAVATYWYGLPGATSNRGPEPEEAAAPLREAQVKKIPGAIECETMLVVASSDGLARSTQTGHLDWSGESQLFVQAKKPGDFVELLVADKTEEPRKVTLYATKSYDYGILRFTVNGKQVEKEYDAYNAQPVLSGPIELGVFEPKDGQFVLRVEVTGTNPASKGPKYYFGLDAVVLQP